MMRIARKGDEYAMKEQTFGSMLARLRREQGMTQLELAEKMGVTDKAVSKWERDLSFPDVGSIPKLAELLNVSADTLLQVKTGKKKFPAQDGAAATALLALKGIAAAMGIAVVVLSMAGELEMAVGIRMLGIGLGCLAVAQLAEGGAEGN